MKYVYSKIGCGLVKNGFRLFVEVPSRRSLEQTPLPIVSKFKQPSDFLKQGCPKKMLRKKIIFTKMVSKTRTFYSSRCVAKQVW
jgi:hypothetical protein